MLVSNKAFNGLLLPAPMARDGVFASMYIREKFTMLPTCTCQSMWTTLHKDIRKMVALQRSSDALTCSDQIMGL